MFKNIFRKEYSYCVEYVGVEGTVLGWRNGILSVSVFDSSLVAYDHIVELAREQGVRRFGPRFNKPKLLSLARV